MGLNEQTGELFAVKQISFLDSTDEEVSWFDDMLFSCGGCKCSYSCRTKSYSSNTQVETLEAEISVMKTLNHRHIVRYIGTGRYIYIYTSHFSL